jgi:UDP-N-acetylglucosamine/UDP-N-acetylgalactosamine diphosphorylase
VLEYSEIGPSLAAQQEADGRLRYGAGNICVHFFSLPFLRRCASHPLPFHVARKEMKWVDLESGEMRQGVGVKWEQFVFDVFPLLPPAELLAVQARRAEEFAPIKNREGADSPRTCLALLSALHRRLLEAAGAQLLPPEVPEDATEDARLALWACEVSPLLTYQGEGLAAFVSGRSFRLPLRLELDPETGEAVQVPPAQ